MRTCKHENVLGGSGLCNLDDSHVPALVGGANGYSVDVVVGISQLIDELIEFVKVMVVKPIKAVFGGPEENVIP